MTKIMDLRETRPLRTVDAYAIPHGTYFYGNVGEKRGLFLKAYYSIISIDNPVNTWSWPGGPAVVQEYQPVDVTITVNHNIEE